MKTKSSALAFVLSGALAAALGAEPALYVESGRYENHDGPVYALRWSPDGARIWDIAAGREEALLEWPGSGAFSVAWSPDGRTIAVGSATGSIYAYDYPSGKRLAQWQAHRGEISSAIICLAWSPDGERLASGSIDFTAKIWDGKAFRGGQPFAGDASGTTVSPASSGEADAPVRVLKASTSARNDINGLAWSPDGTLLATAGQDGSVRIWDTVDGIQIKRLFHGGWVRGLAWSPDGTLIDAGGNSRKITLWDAATGESRGSLEGHAAPVWALQWSPDGTVLASGSGPYASNGGDCSLRLWRVPASGTGSPQARRRVGRIVRPAATLSQSTKRRSGERDPRYETKLSGRRRREVRLGRFRADPAWTAPGKRGRSIMREHGADSRAAADTIHAEAPLAAMFGFSTKLRSASQGRASFSMEFSHFEKKAR